MRAGCTDVGSSQDIIGVASHIIQGLRMMFGTVMWLINSTELGSNCEHHSESSMSYSCTQHHNEHASRESNDTDPVYSAGPLLSTQKLLKTSRLVAASSHVGWLEETMPPTTHPHPDCNWAAVKGRCQHCMLEPFRPTMVMVSV